MTRPRIHCALPTCGLIVPMDEPRVLARWLKQSPGYDGLKMPPSHTVATFHERCWATIEKALRVLEAPV